MATQNPVLDRARRVAKIHQVVAGVAANGLKPITYGTLYERLGLPGEAHIRTKIDFAMWARWLRSRNLPLLYALVVDQKTGLPGDNCDVPVEALAKTWAEIWLKPWDLTPQPTVDELLASDEVSSR